jgi:cytochrome c-type biogenesis protein CcmH/NrfG
VLLHTRRPHQAQEAFQKSIACNPGFPHPYLGLAEVYGRQGRYSEALSALLKGKQLDPDNPAFDCRLATVNSLLHRPEQARAWYNSCIRLSRKGNGADGSGR